MGFCRCVLLGRLAGRAFYDFFGRDALVCGGLLTIKLDCLIWS